MRTTIHKLFWAWDFEKEEQWLNDMASKGLHLVEVGLLRYTFEEGEPNEYEIRFQLLNGLPSTAENKDYINFVEETGAEYVGSVIRWVYFRKKRANGRFELLSDRASRIKQLNMILLFIGIIAGANMPNITINTVNILARYGFHGGWFIVIPFFFLDFFIVYAIIRILIIKRRIQRENSIYE